MFESLEQQKIESGQSIVTLVEALVVVSEKYTFGSVSQYNDTEMNRDEPGSLMPY